MGIWLNDDNSNSLISVGEKAPDFVLDTTSGSQWRLSDQLGNVVALLFYPKNETLVCTRQMCSVRDNWTNYLKTKAAVVGVSPGTIYDHQQFAANYRLPLLADIDRKITALYSQHWLMPVQFTRAIIVIDAKGIVRRREVMLRAFRPTDASVIASIYAARTDSLHEHFDLLKKSRIAH